MSTKFIDTPNPKLAIARFPGAAGIIKVDGGFLVFETIADFRHWKNQEQSSSVTVSRESSALKYLSQAHS